MRRIFVLAATILVAAAGPEPWLVLPPTPALPKAAVSGVATVNGARLWYAQMGRGHTQTVVLLHGGLANSNYWGLLAPDLARDYHVVMIDSRGHGRSGRSDAPYGYELMASDVIGVLDALHIKQAAVVGWSDGAITGLEIALHHPERLTRLFAFAANSDPSGNKPDIDKSPVFTAYIARAGKEYAALNPKPEEYAAFVAAIEKMWASQPYLTAKDLGGIHVPVWIVDGDHDEAIKRENTDFMAGAIPGASEMILPGVSHFAGLQDPVTYGFAVRRFLAEK